MRPGFALTEDNAAAVAEIVRRLEGLPLAIELAAARTRLLEPEALLGRLAKSLDALGTGPVDLPQRQHTLRATVEWSLSLLDDAERSLLEIVAVFADGWTVEAAADVAGLDEDRVLELTEALARHSLVYLDSVSPGPGRGCWIPFASSSPSGSRRGRTPPNPVPPRRRLPGAGRTGRPAAARRRPEQWLGRLQAEAGNLAAAVRWYLAHDPAPLPHLFGVLLPVWALQDDVLGDARSWIGELLPAAGSLDPQARAELLWAAAVTAREVDDDQAALAARERLGQALETIGEPYLRAVSQLAMAAISAVTGQCVGALREASVSLEDPRPG